MNEKVIYYNSITDENLNSNYDIKKFLQERFVVIEFNIHSIKLRSKTSLDNIFIYNFRS